MLAYLLIIVVAFTAMAFALIQLVGEYLFSQKISEDTRSSQSIAVEAVAPLSAKDAEGLFALVTEASRADVRVLILDRNGVVQADSSSELNGTRFHVQEAARVLTGEGSAYGYYTADHLTAAQRLFSAFGRSASTGVFASPITSGSTVIGAAVYISQAQQIYDSINQIQRRIIICAVLVILAVQVMSMFILRKITEPLRELNEGIQMMTRGDFTVRVNVPGKNEFAQLGNAFNVMSERLEKLDQARNQFVSNASHELKTPLATMKIMVESVEQGGDAMPVELRTEFLQDVDKEIDRLNDIVRDLLTLVKIDSEGLQLNLTDIHLVELVGAQVKRLLPYAREQGIEMRFNAKDECHISGDVTKLQQVFYNVIDNAVKYTARGGSVTVDITRKGTRALVKVADSGIGIPEEDIPHIFDRFYRVDKARSRETGGTGLGLSIVKQIVNAHDGDITVTSEENKGSTFIIDLPLQGRG